MNWQRIKTVILHSWYHLNHSLETWVDVLWFPIVQVVVFSVVALYLSQNGARIQAETVIMGLILWEVIAISQYSISMGALWEIWSKSFSNLFITPLTIEEFILGQAIAAFFKALAIFFIASLLSIFFFQFSIFNLGIFLPIYILELFLFSFSAGIFVLSLILRIGTDIQSLAWGLIYVVQPIAAVFYPVEVLPEIVRNFAYLFPITYIFESARLQLFTGNINSQFLFLATFLNLVYICLSFLFLKHMFFKAKESGMFARMES